ncbi:hypothetical protein Lac1_27310 [Claveliimonas bilis]|uniref:Phage protein n=1 Tax=Claveliimonas bilis TaxID=3028070 RepID=A0ABM8IDV7_9FIRM|nr:hypothetical protein Lac1_27310 [Claveliimonas bilis]BDZ80462.1 hypothetical protein Lac3_16710 [Claveliimonas bilis]
MNIRKITDNIILIFCIGYLTLRTIYLEYPENPHLAGFSFFCGLQILIYVIEIWIRERKSK